MTTAEQMEKSKTITPCLSLTRVVLILAALAVSDADRHVHGLAAASRVLRGHGAQRQLGSNESSTNATGPFLPEYDEHDPEFYLLNRKINPEPIPESATPPLVAPGGKKIMESDPIPTPVLEVSITSFPATVTAALKKSFTLRKAVTEGFADATGADYDDVSITSIDAVKKENWSGGSAASRRRLAGAGVAIQVFVSEASKTQMESNIKKAGESGAVVDHIRKQAAKNNVLTADLDTMTKKLTLEITSATVDRVIVTFEYKEAVPVSEVWGTTIMIVVILFLCFIIMTWFCFFRKSSKTHAGHH